MALVAAPVAACLAAGPVLGGIGFAAGGIAKGSMAASFMASYGGAVTAGSACATMQSVGAAGLATTTYVAAGATSTGLAGALFRGNTNDGETKAKKD